MQSAEDTRLHLDESRVLYALLRIASTSLVHSYNATILDSLHTSEKLKKLLLYLGLQALS